MSLAEMIKRVAHKKTDEIMGKKDESLHLPMGIDFQKVMTISPVVFALIDDSLVQSPDTRENIITSISSLKDANGNRIAFRAYTNTGDNGNEAYLQVTTNTENFESIWFTTLTRYYPQTREDLDAFMGKGYGNGDQTFNISRQMLEEIGMDQKVLDKVFKNMDNLSYVREIGDGEYVAPVLCKETRMDSANKESGLSQDVKFMLYSREIANGKKEFLWVSLEAEKTKNGVASNEVHVDFMVGVKVDNNRISII